MVHRNDGSTGTGIPGWDAPLEVLNKDSGSVENTQDREDWKIEDLKQTLKIFIILYRAGSAIGSGRNLKPSIITEWAGTSEIYNAISSSVLSEHKLN